jgi:hypothetical protein
VWVRLPPPAPPFPPQQKVRHAPLLSGLFSSRGQWGAGSGNNNKTCRWSRAWQIGPSGIVLELAQMSRTRAIFSRLNGEPVLLNVEVTFRLFDKYVPAARCWIRSLEKHTLASWASFLPHQTLWVPCGPILISSHTRISHKKGRCIGIGPRPRAVLTTPVPLSRHGFTAKCRNGRGQTGRRAPGY